MSTIWSRVQPEAAKLTRTCSYDRAGLGWSDASPHPRDARQLVQELHTLLARGGVEPPYVLVGNSLGGFVTRLYAAEFPAEVAGMVLVDSAHEDRYPMGEECFLLQKRRSQSTWLFAAVGIVRALVNFQRIPPVERTLEKLPSRVRPIQRAGLSRTSTQITTARELEDQGESAMVNFSPHGVCVAEGATGGGWRGWRCWWRGRPLRFRLYLEFCVNPSGRTAVRPHSGKIHRNRGTAALPSNLELEPTQLNAKPLGGFLHCAEGLMLDLHFCEQQRAGLCVRAVQARP